MVKEFLILRNQIPLPLSHNPAIFSTSESRVCNIYTALFFDINFNIILKNISIASKFSLLSSLPLFKFYFNIIFYHSLRSILRLLSTCSSKWSLPFPLSNQNSAQLSYHPHIVLCPGHLIHHKVVILKLVQKSANYKTRNATQLCLSRSSKKHVRNLTTVSRLLCCGICRRTLS